MEINRDFYREENDVLVNNTFGIYRNAYINSENFTVNQMLDTSPTYMKVKHEDNMFNHIGYVRVGYASSGTVTSGSILGYNLFETPTNEYDNLLLINNPSPLLGKQNNDNQLFFSGNSEYEWGTQCETPHDLKSSSSNPNYKPAIITRFNYANFKLAPFITAYNEDFTQTREFTLQQWDIANYPNVVYIRVVSSFNEVLPTSPLLCYGYEKTLANTLQENSVKSLIYGSPLHNMGSIMLIFGTLNYTMTASGSMTTIRNYIRPDVGLKVHDTTSSSHIIYTDRITKPMITEWMNNLGLIWGGNGIASSSEFLYVPKINNNGELIGGSDVVKDNPDLPQLKWTKPDDVFKNNGVNPTQQDPNDNITTEKTALNTP